MTGISIVCFTASYGLALALEVSRLFFHSGARRVAILGIATAGLVAHTWYLAAHILDSDSPSVSGWYDWYLLAAWVLTATYLYFTFYHPRLPIGVFLLPLVLGLIAVAYRFQDDRSFAGGVRVWGLVHGLSILAGTVVVLVGCVAGLMYLIQADRLKKNLPPPRRFRLPSLEWAERINGRSLVISTILLSVGLLSGLTVNAIRHGRAGEQALPWTDPVVWTSGLLLLWLIVAVLFNAFYRPARQGRKVAYLTMASVIFLLLVLAVVLFAPSQHLRQATDRHEQFVVPPSGGFAPAQHYQQGPGLTAHRPGSGSQGGAP